MPERFNPYKTAAQPDGNGNGILLVNPNPQPEISRFTEENRRWDFQEEASKLYLRAETVMERFYPIFDLSKFDGKLQLLTGFLVLSFQRWGCPRIPFHTFKKC